MKSFGLLVLIVAALFPTTASATERKHLRSSSTRNLAHHGEGDAPVPANPPPRPQPVPVPVQQQRVPVPPPPQDNTNSYGYAEPAYPAPKSYNSYQNPYYKPLRNPPTPNPSDRPTPVPTPRPTLAPTPHPTFSPTPFPTHPPTPLPTPNPTENPTPRPTPSPTPSPTTAPSASPTTPNPSSEPSPQPSPSPTDEPSAPPSPAPSAVPSDPPSLAPSESPSISSQPSPSIRPSDNPTESEEPSNNPTRSEEPSNNPTQSEEPSNNPTQSEEPSEFPTQSEEPSEFPTQSEAPSENPTIRGRRCIVDVICSPTNTNVFGFFCDALQLFPDVVALLQDGCPFDDDDDDINFIPGINRALSESGGNDATDAATVDVKEEQNEEGTRDLQLQNNRFTVFAPNNQAFTKVLSSQLDTLFLAPQSDFVITYFSNERENIYGRLNDYTVRSFFFNDKKLGSLLLRQIILTHIYDRKLRFDQLGCNTAYNMLSDVKTVTGCVNTNGNKFQIGEGNLKQSQNFPQIIQKNIKASNGIIHEVNNIILPLFDPFIIDRPSPITSTVPSGSPSLSSGPSASTNPSAANAN